MSMTIAHSQRLLQLKHLAQALCWGSWAFCGMAHAACDPGKALTKPDERYEQVSETRPSGSEVRDKHTGLVWQRCVQGMVWNGQTCKGRPQKLTWAEAMALAHRVPASAAAPDRHWRMPSIDELKSLPDRSCDHPAINTRWFPATPGDGVWSSTPYSAEHTRTVRVVYFYSGHSDDNDKRTQLLVRWVRAGD